MLLVAIERMQEAWRGKQMQKQQSKEDYSQEEQRPEGELSLEEAFEQIEEVLAHLETEDITLEQSFQEYNRGMKLLQHCNETIDRVEKKVLQMNEDGGLDEF